MGLHPDTPCLREGDQIVRKLLLQNLLPSSNAVGLSFGFEHPKNLFRGPQARIGDIIRCVSSAKMTSIDNSTTRHTHLHVKKPLSERSKVGC